MPESEPPAWGDDSLSQFFKDADYNARVTAAKYPDVFELLRRVHAAFKLGEEAVEQDSGSFRLVPRFLFIRVHSTFLAAIRAAMSGQMSEGFVQLRVAIEQSWYALHMAKDPSENARVETWLRRNDDNQATAKCKTEFTVNNVRATHESLDSSSASQLHRIYEGLINLGAHPNPRGVLMGVSSHEASNQTNFRVGILYPDELSLMVTLRNGVAVAIGALKIFQLIYPERFKLISLDTEIEGLVDAINSQFKQYGVQDRPYTP